jgi:hypothetical protein
MTSLSDILSGSNESAETEQEETAIEQEETEQQQEQQQETGVKESQTAAETEKPEETSEAAGLKAAMIAERKKRQEAEQQLVAHQEAARLAAEEEKPFLGEEYEARFNEVEAKLRNDSTNRVIMMSRELAMDKWSDFAEKETAFLEMAQTNPELVGRMRASANPAAFAYKTVTDAQRIQKLQEMGDPAELEAKIYERVKAELLAEQEKEKAAAVEAAIKTKLKGGFSEQRSVSSERTTFKKFDGPTPLSKLVGHR